MPAIVSGERIFCDLQDDFRGPGAHSLLLENFWRFDLSYHTPLKSHSTHPQITNYRRKRLYEQGVELYTAHMYRRKILFWLPIHGVIYGMVFRLVSPAPEQVILMALEAVIKIK